MGYVQLSFMTDWPSQQKSIWRLTKRPPSVTTGQPLFHCNGYSLWSINKELHSIEIQP